MADLVAVHGLGAHPLGGFPHLGVVRLHRGVDTGVAEHDDEDRHNEAEEVHANYKCVVVHRLQ